MGSGARNSTARTACSLPSRTRTSVDATSKWTGSISRTSLTLTWSRRRIVCGSCPCMTSIAASASGGDVMLDRHALRVYECAAAAHQCCLATLRRRGFAAHLRCVA